MLCKIWGFHGGDYEECRLLGYKNPVRTSQETHYISATEPSQLMLCKIWGCHNGDYEECRLLGCYAAWLFKNRRFGGTSRLHHQSDKNRWTKNVSGNLQPTQAANVFYKLIILLGVVLRPYWLDYGLHNREIAVRFLVETTYIPIFSFCTMLRPVSPFPTT
jgi:hypothetical protein